jgi:hypothetical protein
MSSSRIAFGMLAVAIALDMSACAAFERGEYWSGDTEGATTTDDGGEAGRAQASGGQEAAGSGAEADSEGGSEAGDGSMEISFASEVLPLLHDGCDGCHTADGTASDTSLLLDVDPDAIYEMVLALVDVDAPSESRLLAKAAGKGHNGGVIYDDESAEYETILAWITEGAAP